MGLAIIGAGLPRTGTSSLKVALEQLTGEPCYHMTEVFPRAETHLPLWHRVLSGEIEVTDEILDGFGAAIDWPVSSFWREMAARHPEALVILTRRRDADVWWASAERTVWEAMRRRTGIDAWDDLVDGLRARFHEDVLDAEGARKAYEAHLQTVRASIAADRLLELEPGDGWEPLCAALGVAAPTTPYPHANTTAEFREASGWE